MSDHYLHLQNMRRTIKGQLPPAAQFTAADATLIGQHSQRLLSWSDELVQGFYNTLYAHGPTPKSSKRANAPPVNRRWPSGGSASRLAPSTISSGTG